MNSERLPSAENSEQWYEFWSRASFRPVPYCSFDPSKATDSQLTYYGLPVNIGRTYPFFCNFWNKFLSLGSGGVLNFQPAIQAGGDASRPFAPWTTVSMPMPGESSRNWSGGYVRPSNGRSVTSVMGSWRVPPVYKPVHSNGPEYWSSTWIGLDGQGFYQDASLPQIGTEQVWINGTSTYKAWVQWWARGLNTQPWYLALEVNPGDQIMALMTVLDPKRVRFNIKNHTTGVMLQTFDLPAPGQVSVSGGTAEWIMERPSPLGTDGSEHYELPMYDDFSFTDCLAHSALGVGPVEEHDLQLSRLIRMYVVEQNPPRTRMVSTARRVLPQELQLSYVPA